jgi:predicted HAD superfamily Cof-like phosphohydrolase
MSKNPFEQVREFHEHFDPNTHSEVKALDKKTAEYRSGFKL